MTLAETLRQRCLLSVSLCNVGRDFQTYEMHGYCLNFLANVMVADIICALNQNGFSLHRHETILVGNCCM